ncbi:putative mitochondrial protein Fmp25 [Talaromyces proteolyticus]|uniref:Mitochondrial protein Fmp25 n=1 Tax=Talaromyces proteolyticus TaxID=1131652 RepID=A0AAD4KML6_9EURO|nr:putative mitochondrial protein Fmp25 [Talaromyces proteolyticus]KAH8692680.1 putative mitochondrial protein Fmp25 [Talaromyces proteolyticus]
MFARNTRRQASAISGLSAHLFKARVHSRNTTRSYSQKTSNSPSGNQGWIGPTVALVGTFTLASAAYLYTNKEPAVKQIPARSMKVAVAVEESRVDDTLSKEQNREALSTQHAQVRNMSDNPGVYAWGANSHRVVDPDSSETIIRSPHRIRYFEGRYLRDIKLSETSGAAVTDSGDLVQWGKGFSESEFQPVPTLKGKNLVSISLSRDRIIALSSGGNVYSIPISKSDQESGPKPRETSWIPFRSPRSHISYRPLTPQLGLGEKVTSIASGLEHVLLLTSAGRVFSAAAATEYYPSRGQLGVLGLTWATRPKGPVDRCHEITSLKNFKIQKIASGDFHSLLLDKDGRVFVFGDNSFGQLGIGYDPTTPVIDTPKQLPMKGLYSSKGWATRVTNVAAGGYTSFLTIDAQRAEGSPDDKSDLSPKPASVSVDTWSFGRGIHGALGTGKWTHIQDRPSKVKALSGLSEYDEKAQKVLPIHLVQIAAGATHAAAVLGNNSHLRTSKRSSVADTTWGQDTLWWGGNESLQLGTGKRSNIPTPTHILPPPDIVTSANPDESRFQILPGQQRIECGRQVTAVYSVKS